MTEKYTEKPLGYRIRKVARYSRLYGLPRTLMKVRGQWHMAAQGSAVPAGEWNNAGCKQPESPRRRVALVGCGNFAFSTIAYYCRKHDRMFLRSVFDKDKSRAVSLCRTYGGAKAVDSIEEIAKDPAVKTVFIASNHASHAPYAEKLIAAGKHVHIEKPHVVSWDQLRDLVAVMRANPESRVYLGFNRPRSALFKFICRHLADQPGASMVNWFIAGHDIPKGHWYFSDEEGGRVLGNLCHWTDLTLHLVGGKRAFPVEVIPGSPPGAESDFALAYRFADSSIAAITFSAKGHTFEGVREWLSAHRGDALVSLKDFHEATVDVREKRHRKRLLFRDHGHRENIINSLAMGPAVSVQEIISTAALFLASREAVDSGRTVRVTGDLAERVET